MTPPIRFDAVEHRPEHALAPARWSFQVREGSFSAAAASASTADTVVRLCVGSLAPTEGVVEVLGVRPGELPRTRALRFRRRLGVCFRRVGLVSTASLRENLLLPMVYAREIPRGEASRRVDAAIRDLHLARWADRRPQECPREVRIITALVRAACPEPELLIVETPATGLAPDHAEEVLGWCRERSRTIFVLPPDRTRPITGLADHWIPLAETPEASIDDPPDDSTGTE